MVYTEPQVVIFSIEFLHVRLYLIHAFLLKNLKFVLPPGIETNLSNSKSESGKSSLDGTRGS